MSVGNESRVAADLAGKTASSAKVFCPHCGHDHARRLDRKGFMQRHIYPMFGFFPWYCRECHYNFLLRMRNRRRSSDKQYVKRDS